MRRRVPLAFMDVQLG